MDHCPDGELYLAVLIAALGGLGLYADPNRFIAEGRANREVAGKPKFARRSGEAIAEGPSVTAKSTILPFRSSPYSLPDISSLMTMTRAVLML